MATRDDIDINAFRQRLLNSRDRLRAHNAQQKEHDAVELDQTRTGRLSRMDALQQQAMAQAEQRRAVVNLQGIDAALRRIDSGDFGYCLDCDEPIAQGRLEADPAIGLCVRCAEKRERR